MTNNRRAPDKRSTVDIAHCPCTVRLAGYRVVILSSSRSAPDVGPNAHGRSLCSCESRNGENNVLASFLRLSAAGHPQNSAYLHEPKAIVTRWGHHLTGSDRDFEPESS